MKDDFTGLFVCGFIILLILGLGILLRSGRGAFLISGYNILPKEKKALFNEKALCRLYGNTLLIADFILVFVVIAGIFEATALIIFLCIIIFAISLGTVIYAFTSSKFRN